MSVTALLHNALDTIKRAAGGAPPSDPYEAQYWEMAGAHALLINGLLSIYEQATTISKDKQVDFVKYALLWCATMDHHHNWEENIYYPMFNPKFDTLFIVAEHEGFHAGGVAFEQYLVSALPSGSTYGFGKTAPVHEQRAYDGAKEITYLEPEKVRASGLTADELKTIMDTSDKHMMSMPPSTFLTYTALVTPDWSEFPPAPRFVKNWLVPYVFSLPNRRLWKFVTKA